MSAGLERVFSGAKHTIASERISLGTEMVEISECIKSWVRIRPGRRHAVLSGVFRNSRDVNEAIEILRQVVAAEVDDD
jgi:hypothetical protein